MAPKRLQLFATPVIVDELDDAPTLNAALEPLIRARQQEEPGLRLSNRGGWQSRRDFPTWSGDQGRRLLDHALALATANTAAHSGSAKVRWTLDAWANVNQPGSFNLPHVHGGSFWSAVYFVKVDDGGGDGEGGGGELVLHDPRMPALRMHAPNLRFKQPGPELRALIRPKSGTMVMFPAWMSHGVEPWEGAGTRISVAMNIRAAIA